MTNLDLDRAARAIDLPAGDLDTVTARGATLARRRRRVLAGGVTISVVAASAGLYSRINQPKPVPVAAGAAAAERGDVPIRWERVNSASALGFTTTMSEEALYAVSTAPGRGAPEDQRRFMWHSDDGIEWSAVTELKNDLYIANLADRGTRLYGVGTGPATAAVAGRKPVADLVVGASDDGGRNWTRQSLPVDMRAISAKSRSVGVYAVDVATTKDATVAVAAVNADLDVPAVLPAGKTAPNGWAITESGVDVLGDGPDCPAGTTTAPPGAPDKRAMVEAQTGKTGPAREYQHECYAADGTSRTVTPQEANGVVESFTWDQLHVTGDLLRAVRVEPMLFRAAAGSLTFERVESPEIAKLDGPGMLDRDGDGLLLVGQAGPYGDGGKRDRAESVLLRSTDGRTWTTVTRPAGLSYALAIGRLGESTALLGETASGPTMWVADGSGGWAATSLSSAVDPEVRDKSTVSLAAAAVGRLGAVVVVSVMRDAIAERGGIDIEDSGYTLHVLNERWEATVTDRSGREVARTDNLMDPSNDGALRGGRNGSAMLTDPATGQVLARFAADKFRFEMNGRSTPKYRVLASRDGLTWSDQDAAELAGEPIGSVLRVLMTGERAVISLAAPVTQKGSPDKQVALVGTPR